MNGTYISISVSIVTGPVFKGTSFPFVLLGERDTTEIIIKMMQLCFQVFYILRASLQFAGPCATQFLFLRWESS